MIEPDYAVFSANESLRIISENVDLGLWRTDQSGRFVFANPYMGRIFGHDYHDMLGLSFWQLKNLFGEQWERDVVLHFHQMLRGFSGEFETEITDSGLPHKYLRIAYYPIRNGTYLGSVGIVRDITCKKKILDQLYDLKD